MLHWRALENTHAEIDETENSVATFGLPGKFPLTRVSGALTDGSIIAFSRRSASLELAFRVFRQRRSSFFDRILCPATNSEVDHKRFILR